jgi:hypothetical protein
MHPKENARPAKFFSLSPRQAEAILRKAIQVFRSSLKLFALFQRWKKIHEMELEYYPWAVNLRRLYRVHTHPNVFASLKLYQAAHATPFAYQLCRTSNLIKFT